MRHQIYRSGWVTLADHILTDWYKAFSCTVPPLNLRIAGRLITPHEPLILSSWFCRSDLTYMIKYLENILH